MSPQPCGESINQSSRPLCHLLLIPLELRLGIYDHIFSPPLTLYFRKLDIIKVSSGAEYRLQRTVLLVNKQIRSEGLPRFAASITDLYVTNNAGLFHREVPHVVSAMQFNAEFASRIKSLHLDVWNVIIPNPTRAVFPNLKHITLTLPSEALIEDDRWLPLTDATAVDFALKAMKGPIDDPRPAWVIAMFKDGARCAKLLVQMRLLYALKSAPASALSKRLWCVSAHCFNVEDERC